MPGRHDLRVVGRARVLLLLHVGHADSHILNNYLIKVMTSGINVRMGGYALVEANYFESVLNPVTSRDSSAIGYWELCDNNLATPADVAAGNQFGITWDAGNSGTVNATDWTTTMAFPVALGYRYTADLFQEARAKGRPGSTCRASTASTGSTCQGTVARRWARGLSVRAQTRIARPSTGSTCQGTVAGRWARALSVRAQTRIGRRSRMHRGPQRQRVADSGSATG
jgi:hypothetical protein